MDSAEIKKRLREFVNRITVDYEDFNHLAQFNKKLDQAEKILEYMEAKYELRMERMKENLPEQKVVAKSVKKKVSKKKAESEPVIDVDVESVDG